MLQALAALALTPLLASSPAMCRVGVEARTIHHEGRSYGGHARPIRTIVWYPALGCAPHPLTNASLAGADWVSPVAPLLGWDDRRAARRTFGERLREMRSPQSPGRAWAAGGCAGWLSVPRTAASPLIVIGSGLTGAAYFHSRLAETLAEAGFTVAFVSILGPSPGILPGFDVGSVQLLAEDAAEVIRALKPDPRVDTTRVGLVGWSIAGVAHLMVASQFADVRALVSLDSAVGYEYGSRLWSALPADQVSIRPYLHLAAGIAGPVPRDSTLLRSLGAETRDVAGLTHAQFTDLPGNRSVDTARSRMRLQVRDFLLAHLSLDRTSRPSR